MAIEARSTLEASSASDSELLKSWSPAPAYPQEGKHYSRVKIFGERNTGTNFLEQMVEANLACEVVPGNLPWFFRVGLEYTRVLPEGIHWTIKNTLRDLYFRARASRYFGWKHSKVLTDPAAVKKAYPDDLAIICLVKHPISWSLSFKKRPYGAKNVKSIQEMGLKDFLYSRWTPLGRENVGEPYANVMEIWNVKVRSYLTLAKIRPIYLLRSEDLLADPENTIKGIARHFGLATKPVFSLVEESTKSDKQSNRNSDKFENYRRFYIDEKWREKLPEDYALHYARLTDLDLMRRFRYEVQKS